MIDSDVAMQYHYSTKRINETVNRNKQRFPESFCFQLTEDEVEKMWSQIATTSDIEKQKYRRKGLTSNKSNITKLDIQKFNREYQILKVFKTNKFHDRFIIIDNRELYHLRSIIERFGREMLCN